MLDKAGASCAFVTTAREGSSPVLAQQDTCTRYVNVGALFLTRRVLSGLSAVHSVRREALGCYRQSRGAGASRGTLCQRPLSS
jgi:hypothetical protein